MHMSRPKNDGRTGLPKNDGCSRAIAHQVLTPGTGSSGCDPQTFER